MSITKTGVWVTPSGGGQVKEYEDVGAVNEMYVDELEPATMYIVEAYVETDGGDTVWADSPSSFTTLSAGSATFTNSSGVWGTSVKQLTFNCDWTSVYEVPDSASHFLIYTSASSDFSNPTVIQATYTRQVSGLSGSITGVLTSNIPYGGGNSYYVKCVVIDKYGEQLQSQTFTYTVPTQQAGTMAYSSAKDQTTANTWVFTSGIVANTWTYSPKYKWLIYSDDNWITQNRTSEYSWENAVQITKTFVPDVWKVKLVVEDIYGNTFTSSQETSINANDIAFAVEDNHNGTMTYTITLNPNLTYTSVCMYYKTVTDGSFGHQTCWQPPYSSNTITGNITLANGEYVFMLEVETQGGGTSEAYANITMLDFRYSYTATDCDYFMFNNVYPQRPPFFYNRPYGGNTTGINYSELYTSNDLITWSLYSTETEPPFDTYPETEVPQGTWYMGRLHYANGNFTEFSDKKMVRIGDFDINLGDYQVWFETGFITVNMELSFRVNDSWKDSENTYLSSVTVDIIDSSGNVVAQPNAADISSWWTDGVIRLDHFTLPYDGIQEVYTININAITAVGGIHKSAVIKFQMYPKPCNITTSISPTVGDSQLPNTTVTVTTQPVFNSYTLYLYYRLQGATSWKHASSTTNVVRAEFTSGMTYEWYATITYNAGRSLVRTAVSTYTA